MKRSLCAVTCGLCVSFAVQRAEAQPAAPAPAAAPPAAPAPADAAPAAKPPPPPYSLPWQLRPAAAATVIRSDTALAFHDDATGSGTHAVAEMLLGSYKVTDAFAPFIRRWPRPRDARAADRARRPR